MSQAPITAGGFGVLKVARGEEAIAKEAEAIAARNEQIRHKVMRENTRMKKLLQRIRVELLDSKISKAKMEKIVKDIEEVVSLE
jgi:hypothetical protein